jgi:hypothetical protein
VHCAKQGRILRRPANTTCWPEGTHRRFRPCNRYLSKFRDNVVVWLFAHDMKHKNLILADYFDARRFRSVRASKHILRQVNQLSGIEVTGKIKMEDLANRIAEISHMSRCTSDVAVYRPTLKIILHPRVLSRLQHSYGIPICTFAGMYPEAGGPYSEDCRWTYSEDYGRTRKPTAGMLRP